MDEKIKKKFKSNFYYLLILVLLAFLPYLNSLGADFVSDDRAGILFNTKIGQFSSVTEIPIAFLRPLQYFILFHIGGLTSWVFRLFNISVHAGVVVLLFYFVYLLSTKKNMAFITAALFAVHPILTEAVTWISGGSYELYSFFILLGFISYLLFQRSKKKWLYLLTVFSYILALFSSEKAAVFLMLLPLYEIVFGDLKKNWKLLIPFYCLTAAWFVILLPGVKGRFSSVSQNAFKTGSTTNPFILVPTAISTYLRIIFFPKDLSFYHSDFSMPKWIFFMKSATFIVYVLVTVFSFKKNKYVFFWMSFFLIAFAPTLTPFKISWIVAERYAYLGTMGMTAVVGFFINNLAENKKLEGGAYLVFMLIVTLLFIRTVIRNFDWQNEDSLWVATNKTSPTSPQNHNNLGDMYMRHGDIKQAAIEFQTAIKYYPDYSDAYHNLGNVYQAAGQYDQALVSYFQALKINPYVWQTHDQVGRIYFVKGNITDAIREMKTAIALFPNNPLLHSNLGVIYLKSGDKENARREFEIVLSLDPANQNARIGLSEVIK